MKKLLFIALLALTVSAKAQTSEPKPIADETYIKHSKTTFKVMTVNAKIFGLMLKKFPSIKRYTVVKKKDRVGEYWETEIPFKNSDLKEVETYLKSL